MTPINAFGESRALVYTSRMLHLPKVNRPAYSRAEVLSDAVVHVLGITFALLAVPALITAAALTRGDVPAVLGVTIYGIALLAMLTFSALYNMIPHPDWSRILKRLDHSAIYVKIAGTYTPFALISGHGLALTLGVWGAAVAGVSLKLADPERFRKIGLMLYLGMGWAAAVAAPLFLTALPGPVIWLMGTGGVLYTLGVVFYLWDRLPFHNTIWHVFVLLASVAFFAAVAVALLTI